VPANTLAIDIAGLVCRLVLPSPEWARPLAERYDAFRADPSQPPAWQVELREDGTIAQATPGWIQHDGPVTDFQVSWYRGSIDLAARTAWVTSPRTDLAASAIERTLGYICMQALPRDYDALLLHAVGVVIDGRGYVFYGHSGAGKTTVAGLAQSHGEVLSDENVVVRLADEGAVLYSTPFWGHSTPAELIRRRAGRYPLVGLFSLVHAHAFALTPLTHAQAVTSLLTTEKVATERTESAGAWLEVAGRIVERVPVFRLDFPPTAELWPFLARQMG